MDHGNRGRGGMDDQTGLDDGLIDDIETEQDFLLSERRRSR